MMKTQTQRIALAALVFAILGVTKSIRADTFEIDPVHSSVVFSIKHSGINSIFGLFPDVRGQFSVDGTGNFDVSVGVESVLSGNAGRDRHLKSPDFFSARQFPRIQFKSTEVKRVNDKLEVTGELTLRGITKPVKATMTTATGKGRGGEARGGVQTTLKVKRSDFKLGAAGGLGDQVSVMVSLQGVAR